MQNQIRSLPQPTDIYYIYVIIHRPIPTPQGWHVSCQERRDSRREAKYKNENKRKLPLYALKLQAWLQITLHFIYLWQPRIVASHQNQGLISLGYAPSIPLYKLPPFTSIIHHPSCFPTFRPPFFFFQTIIHRINSPLPELTY